MKFRLDINGLRAIAVMMVAIYHFKYQFGYGGYAGVDVFFVISGFLMNEIYNKVDPDLKSALNFYVRRLNRIYPALLVFVLATFLVLLPTLAPNALMSFAQEAASALTFSSNIFFWRSTSGYFGASADSFALLHTWSLSLEWQFYIVFPAIVFMTHRARRFFPPWGIYLALGGISFGACLILSPKFQNPAFYLLPTRAWELLLGALASALPWRNRAPRTSEVVALASIASFFFLAKDSTNWPGLATLIPTCATAVLLHANVGNEHTSLRFRPFQTIGAASYSIYLAHWPVAHILHAKQIPFSSLNAALGLGASIGIGMLSYKFVEQRFRPQPRHMVALGGAIIAALFITASIGPSKYWLPAETVQLDSYASYSGTERHARQFGKYELACFITSSSSSAKDYDPRCINTSGRPRLLLLGDSHAAQISEAVRREFSEFSVSQATASGCLPLPETFGEKNCTDLMAHIYNDVVPAHKFDVVLIAANWQALSGMDEGLISAIEKANDIFRRSGGIVYVVGQSKVYDHALFKILQTNADPSKHELDRAAQMDRYLQSSLAGLGINYLPVYSFNCAMEFCRYTDGAGEPLMFDESHLTPSWAGVEAALIRSYVMKP